MLLLSGFRNSTLISIHITIQLSLLLYFSKYVRLRQYYEFPLIIRDLRDKTRAMIGRCKFNECVVGRKFL